MKNIYEEWLHSALMDIRIIEKVLDDPFLTPIACFHASCNTLTDTPPSRGDGTT
jgi:hypothetical protein